MGLEQRRVQRASFSLSLFFLSLLFVVLARLGKVTCWGKGRGICSIGRDFEEQWFKKYYNPGTLPPGANGYESYRTVIFWERCLILGVMCP